MNKLYKYILLILIIIFAYMQVLYINEFDKAKNIKVYNTQNIIYTHKTLKELNEELDCLKEKTILSANEIDGKWYIKVKIRGTKEELLNEILKLKNYNITDYVVNKNEDENYVVLEISSKEST